MALGPGMMKAEKCSEARSVVIGSRPVIRRPVVSDVAEEHGTLKNCMLARREQNQEDDRR